MTTFERITYMAHVEGGGSRKTTVTLRDPKTHRGIGPDGNPTITISGQGVNRDGDPTDTIHVLLLTADEEVKRQPLVNDLMYDRLVTPARESAQSRAWRAESKH